LTPTTCPACGKRYVGGLVNYSWVPCGCPGARAGGHQSALCERPGCGFDNLAGHVGDEPEPERMPRLGR
jgi:hypothetical protein